MFEKLDHVAIVVENTGKALLYWRDTLNLPVVHSEIVNNGSVRLTHLGTGEATVQLVEPLIESHPLGEWIRTHGSGLHHICFEAEIAEPVIENLKRTGLEPAQENTHQGIDGKWAVFLKDSGHTGVKVELTGRH